MTDTMPRCNDGSRRHNFSFTDSTNTTLICTRCSRTKPVEPSSPLPPRFAHPLPTPEWETR